MRGDHPRPSACDPVLAIYRLALPRVYGYLLPRCGSAVLAEDLTSETFLAAVDASRQGGRNEASTAWLVDVARHKLVDHWRRTSLTVIRSARAPLVRMAQPLARRFLTRSAVAQPATIQRRYSTCTGDTGIERDSPLTPARKACAPGPCAP